MKERIICESINILKDHFRDEVSKSEWQLVVKIKKLLHIQN